MRLLAYKLASKPIIAENSPVTLFHECSQQGLRHQYGHGRTDGAAPEM